MEEKSPDGYATITKDIFFALKPGENTVTLQFYDSRGTLLSEVSGVSGTFISADWLLTLTVENLRGYELPSTGGIGYPLLILCGMPLILAPLVYGLSLRRRYRKGARE